MKSLNIKFPLILMLFILFLVSSYGYSREIKSTKGTEFIVAFQPNVENLGLAGSLELFLSSELGAEGIVEIPKLGMLIPFSVEPGKGESIAISPLMSKSLGERIDNYAIRVTSNNPISLYGINHKHESTDAFLAIPVHSLGKSYVVMSYAPFYSARSMVIATQDNTEIKLSSPDGVSRTIILNRMQTYYFSLSHAMDPTGTRIESSAPVAVFGGVDCANVPKGIGYCDHLVEMMMPVETWGNSFVTYPLATRLKGDLIRVLAAFDNTEVRINGQLVKVLAKSRYHELISAEPLEIVTSLPVSVAQYSLGQQHDGVISDPFMMLIPPVEQLLNEYTFTTPEAGSSLYFVNVVARTTSLADLRLDGQPINQSLFNPIGNGRYSAAQIPLVVGAHNIKGSNTFGIYVYGYGNYDSYGYPGGMGTEIINTIDSDYRNVSVISSLGTNGIELDVGSFTIAPKQIEEVDGYINIEWFFPTFSIGQIKNLDYEVAARNLLPGEKRTITSSLELRYQDINGVEHKRSLGQQNLNVLASGFALNISTDKAIYGPEQAIKISTQVANAGNAQAVITLEMRILDKDGNFVANVSTPPAFILAAKETIQLSPQQFFTGTTYVGDYQVHAILKDSSGLVVAESTASFEVAAADTVQMSAQVSTDKLIYQIKDNLVIENRFSNLSTNTMLEGITINSRVLDKNGHVYWSQSSPLAQLTPGATDSAQFTVPLIDALVADYTVQVTAVNADGVVLASDQVNFTVQDNPLFALAGSVSAEKAELQLGEQQSCTYTVNNVSAKSIHEQTVRLNLVRVDEALVVKSEEKPVSLTAQTAQSFTPELPVVSHIGNYACVLEAIVAGQSTVLATALFTIKESPIKLSGDITVGEKSRLLVLMDDSTSEKPYLEVLLTQAGWFYTIVTTASDFDAQLRAGGYGAYALLSEKITLTPQTRDALKAQVALGDGLFVASGHDRRHQSLEDALGVRVHAKQAQIKGISVDTSVLGDSWSHTFDEAFNSMTFDVQGATVVGRYLLPSSQGNNSQQSFGAASAFNVFVLENFTSLSSTVEGRIAVGGNLNLQNFSVGDKLDASKLHDVAIVGGKVTFPSGRIYYGNLLAGGSVAGVGDAVRYGMAPGAVIRGNTNVSVDFASERDYLQTLSADIAALPANGTVKMQWGGLELKGDCTSKQQVFTVNANDLATAHTFAVSCIPSGATVIFNIPGQSATIQSIGMQSLSNLREKVLFNFPQAKTLTFKSVAIEGSVLAPYAVVEQPAGRVEGQVIVKSWNSTNWGYMSIHNRTFSGDLSTLTKPKSTNAIAVYQYQQGKTVFASFDVLAQALALHNKPIAADANVFAQLLLAALNQVNPEPVTARAGKVVPVVVTFENTGNQTATGRALLLLSANLGMIQSAEFSLVPETTTWTMPFSLPATGHTSKTLYVRLPASGSAAIQFQLQTSPDGTTRFEKALSLTAN